MGAQIKPDVYRIMKAIFSGVISEAAIMRSPSFSRERSSRTMMNSPFLNAVIVSSMVSNCFAISEEGILNSWCCCVE